MGVFVTRTRIVQVYDGDINAGTQFVLATPVVFKTGPVGTIVLTIADAMALVPANQRPSQFDWWKYILQYLVGAYLRPTIRGVIPNTNSLVFDVDEWADQVTHDAGTPVQRQDTITWQVPAKKVGMTNSTYNSILASSVVTIVDNSLMTAEFLNLPADGRDPRLVTTKDPAQDPQGILSVQAIINADGVFRTIPPTWRNAPGT